MKYLLDTNACIRFLRSPIASPIAQRLLTYRSSEVGICSIVRLELMFGAWRSKQSVVNVPQVMAFCDGLPSLPLDDKVADVAARIRALLATSGCSIGPYDVLIAATALVNGVVLVTHNVSEFQRVQGLSIQDWELP